MARKHYRGFGDTVSLPSLGSISELNPLGKSVNSTDVLVGAFIGLAGGVGVRWALNKANVMAKLPMVVQNHISAVTGVAAGALAYTLERKKNRSRATGHLAGAVLAAVVPSVWVALQQQFPQLADVVGVQMGRYNGVIVNDPRLAAYEGVMVRDPRMAGYADSEDLINLAQNSFNEEAY